MAAPAQGRVIYISRWLSPERSGLELTPRRETMTALSKRIKRAEAKAKRDQAWSNISKRPTRGVVNNLRADIRK